MVHKNIHDKSVEDALTHENGLCVLGFVFNLIPREMEVKTHGLDQLAEVAMNFLTKAGSTLSHGKKTSLQSDLVLANFIPFMVDEYFTYRGSLTTGGCEEAVNWILFKTPLAVKMEHLQALYQLQDPSGKSIINNYRPTMPCNNRPVYYHGNDLLERDIISIGKPIGLRSVKPASICPVSSSILKIPTTEENNLDEKKTTFSSGA